MYVVTPPPPPFSTTGAILLFLAGLALVDFVGSLILHRCFLFRCPECQRNVN